MLNKCIKILFDLSSIHPDPDQDPVPDPDFIIFMLYSKLRLKLSRFGDRTKF